VKEERARQESRLQAAETYKNARLFQTWNFHPPPSSSTSTVNLIYPSPSPKCDNKITFPGDITDNLSGSTLKMDFFAHTTLIDGATLKTGAANDSPPTAKDSAAAAGTGAAVDTPTGAKDSDAAASATQPASKTCINDGACRNTPQVSGDESSSATPNSGKC
jgi:hypothetical protein